MIAQVLVIRSCTNAISLLPETKCAPLVHAAHDHIWLQSICIANKWFYN